MKLIDYIFKNLDVDRFLQDLKKIENSCPK